MARPELGTKRVCPTTGRKFYDLNKDPIVSPYTGEALPRSLLEPHPLPVARAAAPAAARPDDEEEELDVAAGPEVISLEEAAAGEETEAVAGEEATIEEDGAVDDAFLEEEEEEAGVADLIDGEIEDEEEV